MMIKKSQHQNDTDPQRAVNTSRQQDDSTFGISLSIRKERMVCYHVKI